jgi:hypothetical protein
MHRLVPVLAGVLLGMTTACGGSDGDGGPNGAGFEGTYSVAAALAELPYAESRGRTQVIVQTGDLEQATRLTGLERPDDDPTERAEWLRALDRDVTVVAAESTGLRSLMVEGAGDRLGFTAADVRFFAELRDGLDRFAIQRLYDDAKVRDDLPTTAGLRATGEGKPGSFDKDATVTGQFPIVNVLAEGDAHRVAFSTEPADVEAWQAGTGRRLDRNEKLADLAAALDRETVHSAYMVEGSFDQFRGHPPDDAVKEEFDAVAIGLDLDDDTPVVHVGYWFPDDVQAGAEQLRTMWEKGISRRTNRPLSDYVTVRGSRTTGHVVTVELTTSETGPGAVVQMLTAADTPFQGE